MNITDAPMPGVGQTGEIYLCLIARKGDELVLLPEMWDPHRIDYAKEHARRRCTEYDEVILIEGTIRYRVWDREKCGAIVPELAMG